MSEQYDEGSNSVVIGVITDLTKRLETYEANNKADRAQFKATIEDSIVQLRKDFNRALMPLLLANDDHNKIHDLDRLDRIDRQKTIDSNFSDMRVLNYVLIGFLGAFILIGVVLIVLSIQGYHMKSAFGNFDNTGARMAQEFDASVHGVDWYKSKLLSLEDEVKRLQLVIDTKLQFMPDGTRELSQPVVTEAANDVLNVLEYVTKAEWDHFEGLAIVMLANGATLFELQQRLMGLG